MIQRFALFGLAGARAWNQLRQVPRGRDDRYEGEPRLTTGSARLDCGHAQHRTHRPTAREQHHPPMEGDEACGNSFESEKGAR